MKHFILLSILFVILCMTSCQNTKVDDTLTELFEACWNCNESDVFKYIKAEQDDFTITQLGDTQNSVIHYESKQPLISIDNHMATLILEFNNEKLVLCGAQLFFPLRMMKARIIFYIIVRLNMIKTMIKILS